MNSFDLLENYFADFVSEPTLKSGRDRKFSLSQIWISKMQLNNV